MLSFCAFGPDLPDDAYQEWFFLNQTIPPMTKCNGQFLSPVTKNIEIILMTSGEKILTRVFQLQLEFSNEPFRHSISVPIGLQVYSTKTTQHC